MECALLILDCNISSSDSLLRPVFPFCKAPMILSYKLIGAKLLVKKARRHVVKHARAAGRDVDGRLG